MLAADHRVSLCGSIHVSALFRRVCLVYNSDDSSGNHPVHTGMAGEKRSLWCARVYGGFLPVSFDVRHVHGCFYLVRGLGRPDQSCIAAYSITCDYTLHYPDTQRPQR